MKVAEVLRDARTSQGFHEVFVARASKITIIIHLLGLAPAGWVAVPDKRA
jgi:hypothetical protein